MEYLLGALSLAVLVIVVFFVYEAGRMRGADKERKDWLDIEDKRYEAGRRDGELQEREWWLSKQHAEKQPEPEPVDEQAAKRAKEQAKAFNELMTYNVTQAMKGGKKLNESDD